MDTGYSLGCSSKKSESSVHSCLLKPENGKFSSSVSLVGVLPISLALLFMSLFDLCLLQSALFLFCMAYLSVLCEGYYITSFDSEFVVSGCIWWTFCYLTWGFYCSFMFYHMSRVMCAFMLNISCMIEFCFEFGHGNICCQIIVSTIKTIECEI